MARSVPFAWPLVLAGTLLLSGLDLAQAADPVGPPIGSKNRYTTSIRTARGLPDTDDYVGRLLEGETLIVSAVAAKKSDLRPTLTLIAPDGAVIQPVVKSKKGGKVVSFKHPIDRTGAWAVRVGGGATEGAYTVAFKIKGAKPLKFKGVELDGGALEFDDEFGGLEGALLDLKVVFDKKRDAVKIDALEDPEGNDVPGDAGPLAGEAIVKRNKLQISEAPLSRSDGRYRLRLKTDGTRARFTAKVKIVPQGRVKAKKAVELPADEPFLSVSGGRLRAAADAEIPVAGGGFTDDLRAFVGDVEATVVSVGPNGTSFVLRVPAGNIGDVADLRVQNGDGQGAVQEDFLFYAPPPSLTAIRDLSGVGVTGGSTGGGQALRIVGSDLAAEQTVLFGTAPATLVRVVSGSQLEVSTPALGKSIVNVVVRDEFNRVSSTSLSFEFKDPPTFAASPYSPVLAPTNTQTVVTIRGTGFENTDTVLFNGQSTASTLVSGTERTIVVPASSSGDYPVAIRDRVGTLVQGPSFSVKEPPQLTAAGVISGPEAATGEIPLLGGSRIRVTGNHFSENDVVTLGGNTVTVENRSLTQFEFDAPAHAAGQVDLVVTDVGGTSATLVNVLHYQGFADATSTLSPGRNAVDDLSAMTGAVGDLDQDGRKDDVVIASPNYLFNNFYVYPVGTRSAAGYGTYNAPGTRTVYSRVLFGNNTNGALSDLTSTRFPANASDPLGVEDWNATAVAIGDLDGQNGPEIILGGIAPLYTLANDVRVLRNNGAGTFTHASALQTASRYVAPYYVYYQYGGAVNTAYQYVVTTARYILGIPTGIALGDLDGDNDLDVVVARDYHDRLYAGVNPTYVGTTSGYATLNYAYVYGYFNNGTYQNLYIGQEYYYSALTLLDNDIGNGNGLVDRSGTRLPAVGNSNQNPVPAFHGRDVAIGDLDGQNGLDIVVTWDDPTTVSAYGLYYGSGYDSARVATRVLLNNGSGTFTDATTTWMPTGSQAEFFQGHQVELSDLDGDGDLDMVILHKTGVDAHVTGGPTHTQHALRILRNDRPTSTAFRNVTSTALPALPTTSNDDFRGGALVVRDVNGDGLPDIIVATTEVLATSTGGTLRSTRVFLGTGNLTFKRADDFLPAVTSDTGEADTLLLGDLAGSGLPTLILLSETAPATSGSNEFLRTHRWTK